MRLPPLVATLTRHKLTVALMLLATAFTCAIVINIASMIAHHWTLLAMPSGLAETEVVTIDSAQIRAANQDTDSANEDKFGDYEADVTALRGIAGVQSAAVVSGLPMDGGMAIDVTAKSNAAEDAGLQVTAFVGGPDELETLGLHLIHGRDFRRSEYVPQNGFNGVKKISTVIISHALAKRLFHGAHAVGELVYASGHAMRVVGVVEHLLGMNPQLGASDNEYTMLLPLQPDGDYVTFVLRTSPTDRDSVLMRAVQVLTSRDPQRVLEYAQTFTQLRAAYFRRDSAMIRLLVAAGLGLLIVTGAGLAGLASFWVQQRTRSIGVRRAVGATRTQILRYFHAENFLIVTCGIILGCAFAYTINILLMRHYALQALPTEYLVIGAVLLWLMGQVAVLGPAWRGASIPPAAATRAA